MIRWLRKVFTRDDPVEDLISAYVDSDESAELKQVEQRLREAGVDVEELRSVRETANLLSGLDTVEAPKSYALTPDTLAERGYSEREIERILNPRRRFADLRLGRPAVYVPLAIGALALIGVAMLTIGDITEYATDRFDAPSGDTIVQTVVVEKEVVVVQTVVVEKEVVVAGETMVQTVVVEKEVEVAKVVEVERVVTVVVEKEVVKEVEVEKEFIVEREAMIAEESAPPEATPAPEVAEFKIELSSGEPEPTATAFPAQNPCAIDPSATPTTEPYPHTPSASPTATPTATATVTLVPTCTPTPTPSPTPMPSPVVSPTPTATLAPTPTQSPTPVR